MAPSYEITDLLHVLAAGAVDGQALMDGRWHEEASRWRDLVGHFVSQAPAERQAEIAAVLGPTAPVRQVFQRSTIECTVRHRVDWQRGVAIGVQPLELGWSLVTGTTRESASRVTVEVVSVPMPTEPAFTTGLPAFTQPPLSPAPPSTPPQGGHD